MNTINISKNHEVYYPLILVYLLFFLFFFSCKKDEFNPSNEMVVSVSEPLMQPGLLSGSSVSYFPAKTFTIVAKETIDQKILLENVNFKYYENFILTVQNGNSSNTKVQKVEILINGITVISTSDFRKKTSFVSKPLSGLTQSSLMEVRLDGSKNRFITLSIECELKPDVIRDIDGNYYNTVKIGTQQWMAENLKTTRFSDGSSIQLITDTTEWKGISTPGYCFYNNDEAYKTTYGALYNWYAVDNDKLCPAGWHITNLDWGTLIQFLGGKFQAGDKLKESGDSHWVEGNQATNDFGFTALPGGLRGANGTFAGLGTVGSWWTSIEYIQYPSWAYTYYMITSLSKVDSYAGSKNMGLSVRCVREN